MKKINLLVMSLVSAAALSFSSCSSDNDLGGGASGGNSQVDGFYMTLAIQTPTSNGTRTAQSNEAPATADESDVTTGTFYLVDALGNVTFSKTISAADWQDKKNPTQGQIGKKQLEIRVENVAAGAKYKVYFLANITDAKPWENTIQAESPFAKPFDTPKHFAMFNQNDNGYNNITGMDGNGYTVVFTDDNKKSDNAAEVKYNGVTAPIKIERITARIDQPKTGTTDVIASIEGKENIVATEPEKSAMADAKDKVESITMKQYAITNLANTTYIMQKWNEKQLQIPTSATGFTYYQPATALGSATKLANASYFKPITTEGASEYVFENHSDENATTMYFEYEVKLNKNKFETTADFEDGTFYRYNNKIYNSFAGIRKAYKEVVGLFDGKTDEELVAELTAAKNDATDPEAAIATFRETYKIEVFNKGKTYYHTVIKDNFIGYDNAIQRNSVYQLTVNNIFNVGAQVPNGTPDKNALFYLDVTVSVNPWVLNTQDVNLQ